MSTDSIPQQANSLTATLYQTLKRHPKRIVFTDGEDMRVIRVAARMVAMEIAAPIPFVGKNLRDLALRQRYGVQVYLIKKSPAAKAGRDAMTEVVPVPDTVIERGDILVLAGREEALRKLRNL